MTEASSLLFCEGNNRVQVLPVDWKRRLLNYMPAKDEFSNVYRLPQLNSKRPPKSLVLKRINSVGFFKDDLETAYNEVKKGG